MDKLSTYHSAATEEVWLVVILSTNQIIATLYCTKVAVTILITATHASAQSFPILQCVMKHPHVMMVLPSLRQIQDMECAIRIFNSTHDQINACKLI